MEIVLLLVWIGSAAVAASIVPEDKSMMAAFIGFFLGPLGVVVAYAAYNR